MIHGSAAPVTLKPSLHILIVEDDPDFRATLCDWLDCSGYAVSQASNGLEALTLAQQRHFDAVVTDLKLPMMDGLQLLDGLQAIDPELPVIFLSGQATVRDAVAALRDGKGFDFLEKPLADLSVINQVLDRALDRSSRKEASREMAETSQEATGDASLKARVLAVIEESYADTLSLQTVAGRLGYSPAYLTNLLSRETGKTIQQWISEVRMRHARRLLIETEAPVNQIATLVGYADPNYFVRQFRKLYGVPPMTWRQMNAGRPTER